MIAFYILFAKLIVIHEEVVSMASAQSEVFESLMRLKSHFTIMIVGSRAGLSEVESVIIRTGDLENIFIAYDNEASQACRKYFAELSGTDLENSAIKSEEDCAIMSHNGEITDIQNETAQDKLLPKIEGFLRENDFEIWISQDHFHVKEIEIQSIKELKTQINNHKPVMILDVDDTFCGVSEYDVHRNPSYYARHGTIDFISGAQVHFDVYLVSLSSKYWIYQKLTQLGLLNMIQDDHIIGVYNLHCLKYYYIYKYAHKNRCITDSTCFIESNDNVSESDRRAVVEAWRSYFDILADYPAKFLLSIPSIEQRIKNGDFVIVDDNTNPYKEEYEHKIAQVEPMDGSADKVFEWLAQDDFSILKYLSKLQVDPKNGL
eukprot:NODE_690_length_5158_cov_0.250494.p2 type:complete len:375 gc:universal NODE_690_length_5158_cov_0.250494:207-1331(+)